ncbi:MAG: GDP-mannose dehydrogenase, partial [Candidatus Bathyarchaeota archaeon]|nr:GDP-mannose dehydrogenase [Candidatus Bathyarchaeota archaeon]
AVLSKESVLVVGLGEVGRALYEILTERETFLVFGFDVDSEKMRATGVKEKPRKVDVMHICIPCHSQRDFVKSVADYIERFNPKLTIINSTVQPTTTEKIQEQCSCHIAHSPIRGIHKNLEHMKWELRRWTKYVGGVDDKSAELASEHFRKMGLKVKILRSARETELAKLFETTYRSWMIACFQEMHRISRHFGAAFDEVADFLEDTHRVRFDRPVMFPEVIGGHCLIPNIELLLGTYNSEFLRLILRSNEKRKGEIKEEQVREEVEKIRKRTENLEKRLNKFYVP